MNPRSWNETTQLNYALIIFIIGSILIAGFALTPVLSLKFIITLNEGLRLQLWGQNS